MIRYGVCLAIGLCVAGCGGQPTSGTQAFVADAPRFSSGPIGAACLANGRASSTPGRCGCVQAAADLTLNASQQKRSVAYFNDPEELEELKRSQDARDERFWDLWMNFSDTAEAICQSV